MNNTSLSLLRALWEDFILLVFLGTLALSGVEALLPEIVLSRLPLALLFFVFFAALLGYLLRYKELPFPPLTATPLWVKVLLTVTIFLVLLINLRGFGIMGAVVQIFLLALLFWFIIKK